MGDFSRDTFKLTNVMHQLLNAAAVTGPRHYVGVRLQQGVPVLDADFNELDDIRKHEVRALLGYFIGNGVPAGDTGFEISGSGAANDFTVNAGVLALDGMLVINPGVTTYGGQPESATLPLLTTPISGLDRTDLVYLDVWEQETGAIDTVNPDERIVNQYIGVETARRLERRWAVRVAEGVSDIGGITQESGHHYAELAQLARASNVAAINDSMVIDRRRRGITLAENLKIPLYVRRGTEIVDSDRFAQMLNGLRTTLFDRLRDDTLPYQGIAPDPARNETLIMMSLQELMHLCQTGEVQASGGVLDNDDALAFLRRLYDAQHGWLTLVEEIGNDASVAQTFLEDYREYLDGAGAISGLDPALDDGDLLFSVLAQEELNSWLSATTDNLPEGSVDALYLTAIPYANMTAGETYDFTYEVSANFTSPLGDEDFEVLVSLNSAFGTAVPDQSSLTFSAPEGQTTLTVTVTPSGSLVTADLDVIVRSVRNPLLRSTQLPVALELNQLPPVATFFFYAGERFEISGRLEIAQNLITQTLGYNVLFKLRNTGGSSQAYSVVARVEPVVADTAGWTPLSDTAVSGSPFTVGAGDEDDVLIRVRANDPANVPDVGATGNIFATATIDGTTDTVTVTIPFVIGDPI